MKAIHMNVPADRQRLASLRCGDSILLSGIIYTARDAAHARLCQTLAEDECLPIDLKEQMIFYAGPTPPPPNEITGSIGPTTSVRMDAYTPQLLAYGVQGMIGKGERSQTVKEAIRKFGAVYFAAAGGCAAYMAACIKDCEVVAYDDLGTESIKRLTVENLPLTVAVDAQGNDFYELSLERYRDALC